MRIYLNLKWKLSINVIPECLGSWKLGAWSRELGATSHDGLSSLGTDFLPFSIFVSIAESVDFFLGAGCLFDAYVFHSIGFTYLCCTSCQ
jgi:hypothetical protein